MKNETIITGNLRYFINVLKVSKVKVGSSFSLNYEVLYNGLKAERKYINGSKVIDNDEIFNSRTLQFIKYYRTGIYETCVIEF